MLLVTQELRAAGKPVLYMAHDLPSELFLDDCHLTDEGNRALAARFLETAIPLLMAERRPVGPSVRSAGGHVSSPDFM